MVSGSKKEKKSKKKTKSLSVKSKKTKSKINQNENKITQNDETNQQFPSSAEQLKFFVTEFQSANGVQLSSLEIESIKDSSFVELSSPFSQDVSELGKHIKAAFGSSWKEVLCGGQLVEGEIEPGSPSVLFLSSSALRSIELLRGVCSMTKECRAVKLFSKHMKVEEQVSLLKKRVNIASGTPSRIKKLIDMEALGLSRLRMLLLDVHTDVKGYSLLTLPQVSDEFWDLYKTYFHQLLLKGNLQICLYGPVSTGNKLKGKKRKRATSE